MITVDNRGEGAPIVTFWPIGGEGQIPRHKLVQMPAEGRQKFFLRGYTQIRSKNMLFQSKNGKRVNKFLTHCTDIRCPEVILSSGDIHIWSKIEFFREK